MLDVGAGDGWFAGRLLGELPDGAGIVCWDTNYDDDELAAAAPGIVRTREHPRDGYDLVLVLDVLEHIADAERFIVESLSPVADPGTPVLVAVPAHQWLFGAHDVALGHHRRYGRGELRRLVAPWIDVVEEGSLFTTLLAPRAAQVAVERVRGRQPGGPRDDTHGVGTWSGGRATTALVDAALAADVGLGRTLGRIGVRLPGLSIWVFGTVR